CLMELYRAEQAKELSNMLTIGNETFENFRLDYYNDTPTERGALSPRALMTIVFNSCVRYANTFGKNSKNMFFTGAPGLGKTYLSACIAKVVFEKGRSVVYSTASQVFSAFEKAHFDRDEDAKEERERLLGCDLLILDDLGTEMTTAFTVSALYEIVNTRLTTGKKTIISTNLTVPEISARYSAQIASRIGGEYLTMQFYGEDIRILKNKNI
ncbi:MAG: ATP-binding protein, partial [Oscillospiraceae bacterium]|nr:ATP-binding protein [Oscillospiraceae bacterium]